MQMCAVRRTVPRYLPLRLVGNSSRQFSSAMMIQSHVGSAPIIVPDGVKISLDNKQLDLIHRQKMEIDTLRNGKPKVNLTKEVHIEGPKGSVTLDIAEFVDITLTDGASRATVAIEDIEHQGQRKMWGTTRSLLSNSIIGVSEGHISILKLVGTGYRAAVEGKNLILRLGFSQPVSVAIPEDISIQVPVPNRIIVEGIDKQKVKQYAANIRKLRPPEPYKGKGVFVDGETIKLKQRKIK